jgi:hypothetical protein
MDADIMRRDYQQGETARPAQALAFAPRFLTRLLCLSPPLNVTNELQLTSLTTTRLMRTLKVHNMTHLQLSKQHLRCLACGI